MKITPEMMLSQYVQRRAADGDSEAVRTLAIVSGLTEAAQARSDQRSRDTHAMPKCQCGNLLSLAVCEAGGTTCPRCL